MKKRKIMKMLNKLEIKELMEKSYNSRINILKMMEKGEGHIGGAFSALDIKRTGGTVKKVRKINNLGKVFNTKLLKNLYCSL